MCILRFVFVICLIAALLLQLTLQLTEYRSAHSLLISTLKERVRPDQIVTLTFHKTAAKRLGHEFTFRGRRFDVLDALPSGDSLRLVCFDDRAETDLVITFQAKIRTWLGLNEGVPHGKKVKKPLLQLFFEPDSSPDMIATSIVPQTHNFILLPPICSEVATSLSPPPEEFRA